MILSLNWLKSMVDLEGLEPEEIANRISLSTAEVEEIRKVGDNIADVVVAKVVTCEKLANSNHLNLLSVDDGTPEPLQIVTGAPNVYAGMKTALVRVGGKIDGKTIKKAKLAGTDSYGMCCSEAELGIGSDDDGIVDFTNTNYAVGTDLKELFPIEDYLIEIDNKSLTNRPDLWGHLGFARELSAIFDRKLKPIDLVDIKKFDGLKQLPIKIQSRYCFRYSSVMVDNVNVKRSPYEMKIRLNYCGLRDINLLADLTNYVMLEIGNPMHAFDSSKVDGVIVREAIEGEKLLTLEGEEHDIPAGVMLVCDRQNNPVAIAGVKGGLKSGISDDTTGFLLESAVFEYSKIRKASQAIGLSTDASVRYEKSLDPEMTPIALARLISHLKTIDPGIIVCSEVTDVINYDRRVLEIDLDTNFIRERIGVQVSNEYIFDTLSKLGFTIRNINGDNAVISVPSYRATKDISIKEDIVEEIARMYGYDNIVPVSIKTDAVPVAQDKKHVNEYKIKRLLAEKYGFSEVHSYIWNYEEYNNSIGYKTKSYVNLVDASNSGQSGIRSEIAPVLIKMVDENKNNFPEIKILEVARVCTGLNDENSAIEERHFALAQYSTSLSAEELYFELKKYVMNIAQSLAKVDVEFDNQEEIENLHGGMSTKLKVNGEVVGYMGILHPMISQKIDKKGNIGLVEFDFDKFMLFNKPQATFKHFTKFQAVDLDFNFVVPENLIYADIEKQIALFRCKFDVKYSLKDVYKNEKVLGNKTSMTFGFNISSKDHTLTANEIDNFSKRLIDHMKQIGIELR